MARPATGSASADSNGASRAACSALTSGLSGTGIVDEVRANFKDAGVAVTIYDKVESLVQRATSAVS